MPSYRKIEEVISDGGETFALDNPQVNLKMTHPADVAVAALILATRP